LKGKGKENMGSMSNPDAIAMVAGLANFIMMLIVKRAVSDIKAFIAEARRTDEKELRQWVEDHFQRRVEAQRT
jgi:hypothetical protein